MSRIATIAGRAGQQVRLIVKVQSVTKADYTEFSADAGNSNTFTVVLAATNDKIKQGDALEVRGTVSADCTKLTDSVVEATFPSVDFSVYLPHMTRLEDPSARSLFV